MGDKHREKRFKLNRQGVRDLNHYDYVFRKKRDRVLKKTDGHCAYCGVEISFREMTATIDHVIPVSRQDNHDSNLNDESNLVPACKSCNHEKGDRDVEEYRALRVQKTGAAVFFYFEVMPLSGNCHDCSAPIQENGDCECVVSR